jgi:hypothetical protein
MKEQNIGEGGKVVFFFSHHASLGTVSTECDSPHSGLVFLHAPPVVLPAAGPPPPVRCCAKVGDPAL